MSNTNIDKGKLKHLIADLVKEDDSFQINASTFHLFFTTFRTFAQPKKVLEEIIQTYFSANEQQFLHIIQWWLEEYPEDFLDYPDLYVFFNQFCLQNGYTDLLNRLDCLLKKLRLEKEEQHKHERLIETLQTTSNENFLYHFQTWPSEYIAEKLNHLDVILFLNLRPYDCLVWSSSNKPKSVQKSVTQFNILSNVVKSIVLKTKTDYPGLLIAKWIEIAQVLRTMKNFSSLKAIITTLDNSEIHRLHNAWNQVPEHTKTAFFDLVLLMGYENNHELIRRALDKEGTAKHANVSECNLLSPHSNILTNLSSSLTSLLHSTSTDSNTTSPSLNKSNLSTSSNQTYGTVPYLGTFLYDLTMLDSAHKKFLGPDVINFEKLRKQFSILVQLKLFQKTCRMYHSLDAGDIVFESWLYTVPSYTPQEYMEFSFKLEPSHVTAHTSNIAKLRARKGRDGMGTVRRAFSSFSFAHLPDNTQVTLARSSSNRDLCAFDTQSVEYILAKVVFESIEVKEPKTKFVKLDSRMKVDKLIEEMCCKFGLDIEDAEDYKAEQLLGDGRRVHFDRFSDIYSCLVPSLDANLSPVIAIFPNAHPSFVNTSPLIHAVRLDPPTVKKSGNIKRLRSFKKFFNFTKK